MNGEFIPAARGGPARMVMAGGYGDKSIKWVNRVVLTNDFKANDSDAADFNADVETATKTKARFINAPKEVTAGKPAALTGFALVGISGIDKVQYCVHSQKEPWPADDPYWTKADWKDAAVLPPPADWGGGLPGGRLPANTSQIDPAKGTPLEWPLRFTIAHWAALLPGMAAGTLRLVLPYHRPQRHRSAAAASAPKDRRQRHPPRHRGREGLNDAVTPRRRIGNSRRVARRLLGPGAAEACRGVPCRWRSGKPAFRYLVPALRFG